MPKLIVVCAWCKPPRVVREEESGKDMTTHTCCPSCVEKQQAEIAALQVVKVQPVKG